jgi:formylglycine-generating enzyme required for sulfatase activity
VLNLVKFETISVDRRGAIIARRSCSARQFAESLGGDVVLEMIAVPGGTFSMGSPQGSGYADEHPQHQVTVAPFLMGKHPVTQEQWAAVVGPLPSCRFKGIKRPLENVSWDSAREFCERLSKLTGRAYGLPNEAQWEYACRARTMTPFHTGETITTDLANYNGEHTYRAEPKGVYRHEPTDAGTFPPNGFGLHDMHGNLWEWCADTWHDDYRGAPADGSAWEAGGELAYRVARGGSWHDTPDVCRSAVRLRFRAAEGDDFVGFRVMMIPGEAPRTRLESEDVQ